jgi:hypothetical protein
MLEVLELFGIAWDRRGLQENSCEDHPKVLHHIDRYKFDDSFFVANKERKRIINFLPFRVEWPVKAEHYPNIQKFLMLQE